MNNSKFVLKFNSLVKASLLAWVIVLPAFGASEGEDGSVSLHRYVVELQDPPLALYRGGELSVTSTLLAPTSPDVTREPRLNVRSSESRAYLAFLTERQRAFEAELQILLGRVPVITHRLFNNFLKGVELNNFF